MSAPTSCCTSLVRWMETHPAAITLYVVSMIALIVTPLLLHASPLTKGIIGGSIVGIHIIGAILYKVIVKSDMTKWLSQEGFKKEGELYVQRLIDGPHARADRESLKSEVVSRRGESMRERPDCVEIVEIAGNIVPMTEMLYYIHTSVKVRVS